MYLMKFESGQIAASLEKLQKQVLFAVGTMDPNNLEEVADRLHTLYCEVMELLESKGCDVDDEDEPNELPMLPIKLEHLHLLSHDELSKIKNELNEIETILGRKLTENEDS